MNTTFEAILDIEAEIRGERVSAAFGVEHPQRIRAMRRVLALKAKLYKAIDELTDSELVEFAEYRKTAR